MNILLFIHFMTIRESIEKINQKRNLIVNELQYWAETFDIETDEEGEPSDKAFNHITKLARNLKNDICSDKDYEDIIFHIYQINYNEIIIAL